MSRWRVMAVALTALVAMPIVAPADDYPTHNVTILVPFAPGGGTDLLARSYAQILEKKYGKSFIVENRPGGGTTLAATATANAKPDGYTLMQGTSGTMAMNPTIFKHLNYEPLKTLVPVVGGGRRAVRADRESGTAGTQRGRPDCARQEKVGRRQAVDLRLRRRRRVPPSLCRVVQQPGRHRDDPRALSGQRAGDAGADLGPGRRAVRRSRANVAADQGGQGPRPRHHQQEGVPHGTGHQAARRGRHAILAGHRCLADAARDRRHAEADP